MKLKMYLIIPFITLFFPIFPFGYINLSPHIYYNSPETINKSLLKDFKIKSIKTIALFTSSITNKGGSRSSWVKKPWALQEFEFDKNYNLIKKIQPKRYSGVGYVDITENTYDSNENLIISKMYHDLDTGTKARKDVTYCFDLATTTYEYFNDKNHKIVKILSPYCSSYETIICSDKKITDKLIINYSNSAINIKYNYDKNDNLIEEIHYFPYLIHNKLHEHINTTAECICYPFNEKNFKIIYKYDIFNNLIAKITKNHLNKIVSKELLHHNYALNITLVEYFTDNIPFKREIIYFNNRNLITKKEIYCRDINHLFEIQTFTYE